MSRKSALISLIKKYGFSPGIPNAFPEKDTTRAYACVITQDFMKELVAWIVATEDANEDTLEIMRDVADNHLSKRGGNVFD